MGLKMPEEYKGEIREFHLVEENGSKWWFEYTPHPYDGKMSYLNFAGAGCSTRPEQKVLKKEKVEWFTDLDWAGTALEVPDSDAGWLDRTGRFHGCHSEAHDMYARYRLKEKVIDLENKGWVRVYGKPGDKPEWSLGYQHGLRLSAEQRMWLDRRGYTLYETD